MALLESASPALQHNGRATCRRHHTRALGVASCMWRCFMHASIFGVLPHAWTWRCFMHATNTSRYVRVHVESVTHQGCQY
jgi:hypothetical protein